MSGGDVGGGVVVMIVAEGGDASYGVSRLVPKATPVATDFHGLFRFLLNLNATMGISTLCQRKRISRWTDVEGGHLDNASLGWIDQSVARTKEEMPTSPLLKRVSKRRKASVQQLEEMDVNTPKKVQNTYD
ncbi:hypothetical protein L2E82_51254 [Cichorium intybus]|nr:hypothetical protein L2E82_51254 [Cichorium intybus]